jgi:uncharacterized protein YacL
MMETAGDSSQQVGVMKKSRPNPDPVAQPPVDGGAGSRLVALLNRRPVYLAFSAVFTVLSCVIGFLLAREYTYLPVVKSMSDSYQSFSVLSITVLGGLLGFLGASAVLRWLVALVPRLEQMPAEDKVAGVIGVVLGLLVAVLLQPLVLQAGPFANVLVVVAYFFSVFFGVLFAMTMKKELVRMFAPAAPVLADGERLSSNLAAPKLLDTNVVIDGRILEVWNSGFVEGDLLVPQFVLDELQTIADSADDLKRARGRRGLDLLNRLKEEVPTFHVLRPRDYAISVADAEGVDGKLVKLAAAMEASLLTNDFNLSKVAELQGIAVLNVNRLALALKPVVMAGEEMRVNIIRHGRDPGQGVAYLDDGTMVVIEDGEPKIGRVVDVVVTSMIQTMAGKMIFAVLKDTHGGGNHR